TLQAKPNLGLALSGGGYRAATLSLGWVRGLHMLGVLPHLRYVSSNSGGSWFNGAMSYGGFPLGPFLGPYSPPANLSRDALGSPSLLPPGSFGDTLAKEDIVAKAVKGVIKDLFKPGHNSFSGWTAAIAAAFYDPYGLGLQNSSLTCEGTRGNVSARLAAAYPGMPLYAAMSSPDRPFPIILGSIMRVLTDQVFYPFEVTPLYLGDPARNTTTFPALGPGFVEPLGFNSAPPDTRPVGGQAVGLQGTVNVTPSMLVPLSTFVGISSSFISQGVRPEHSAMYALTGTERLLYWNQLDYSGARVPFADGAGADNSGITPLLRRRVTHIVSCASSVNPANISAAEWAIAQHDVASLFGAVPLNITNTKKYRKHGINGVQPGVYNAAHQVFPQERYAELYNALYSSLSAGRPAVHRASYPVLDNAAQAITGGWQVEMLWLFNMQISDWEEQLPVDTRTFLNESRYKKKSDMRHYPYISTFTANYTPELVTLLSQQASWSVLQAAPE
ncbi:hypothetical protein Agub_g1894, partial [Astrephomene gubernaculifera]